MHQTSSRTIRITVKCLDEVICEHPGRSRGSSSQKELRAVRDCRQFKEVAAMAGGMVRDECRAGVGKLFL